MKIVDQFNEVAEVVNTSFNLAYKPFTELVKLESVFSKYKLRSAPLKTSVWPTPINENQYTLNSLRFQFWKGVRVLGYQKAGTDEKEEVREVGNTRELK